MAYLLGVGTNETAAATPKSEILLAMTAGEPPSPALGSIWRITAKKSDFYLDTVGSTGDTMHVSLHGPRDGFSDHRFHLKVDRRAAEAANAAGHFVQHGVPRRGQVFTGQKVSENAFRVVRLRWRWHLQRPRFRMAAYYGEPPTIGGGRSGHVMRGTLNPNSAWDVDIFLSYDRPYWPLEFGSKTGEPHLGPVSNDSGMFLTATSTHRSELANPSPPGLVPRSPARGETPTRLSCGGLGSDRENDMYWFVETITAREHLAQGSL